MGSESVGLGCGIQKGQIMEFWAKKIPAGFVIIGEAHKQAFERLTDGQTYKLKVTKDRTKGFHRKVLGLFRVCFDFWEPEDDNLPPGVKAEKDFDHMREKLTIRAGFYRQVFNPDGTFEVKAKSIAWDQMEEAEFMELFDSLINVILNDSPDIMPKDPVTAKHFRELVFQFL